MGQTVRQVPFTAGVGVAIQEFTRLFAATSRVDRWRRLFRFSALRKAAPARSLTGFPGKPPLFKVAVPTTTTIDFLNPLAARFFSLPGEVGR